MIKSWIRQNVFPRLTSRLLLTSSATNDPLSLEMGGAVVPVTNVDDLLRTLNLVAVVPVVDPGSTGTKTVATVPAGKRWRLHALDAYKASGTTLTIAIVYIYAPGGTVGYPLVTQVGATRLTYISDYGRLLDQNWYIAVNIATYTAGDTWSVQLEYEEENAY